MTKKKKFISIDKRLLTEGQKLKFKVYESNESKSAMTLFLQSDSVLDGTTKVQLREIEQLYVDEMSYKEYEKYITEHIQTIVKNPELSLDDKAAVLYESATRIMEQLFENPESLEALKESKEVVGGFIETTLSDPSAVQSLMKITAHDYYTHTHSINVSIYAICLGTYLGLCEETLYDLGTSAMLHDIGKSRIDYEIINKNGALSDEEFAQMKYHASYGYEIALNLGITDRDILSGIRHHHEKMDGHGYPDGIEKKNISQFARIIGACDVFDALTTKRSYKDPFSSFDALALMKNRMDTHLDMEVVDQFILMLRDRKSS